MTTELTYLAWALVLGLVQIIAAALAKRGQEPRLWAAGPRDESEPRYTGIAARLARAQANLLETLPLFAAAVLVAHVAGRDGSLTTWGSELYFWARLAYVPAYVSGVRYARTVVWIAATAGLGLVFTACLAPA